MKILYIITQSEFGGAQRNIFDLASFFSKENNVFVAAGGHSKLFEKLEKNNIKSFRLKYLKRSINPFYEILALFELAFLIRKINPDIVHLHSSKISVLGSIAAKLAGINKIIYTAHGFVFNEPGFFPKKKIFIWAEKISGFFKDKIICVSEKDRQSALKYKITPENKLATIYNGIDIEKCSFLDKEEAKNVLETVHFNSKAKNIVGTIAHFYLVKGLAYLIEAAKEVIKEHPDTLFLLIGGGKEHHKLQSLIEKYRLETNVFLIDEIQDAAKLIKVFDIFVLPSLKEGFPYAVLEAMAAEIPIVASKVGGIPEQIENGKQGFLAEPKNSKELAEKINLLLSNKELANKLAQNAKEKVEKEFSLAQMIEKTKEVYGL